MLPLGIVAQGFERVGHINVRSGRIERHLRTLSDIVPWRAWVVSGRGGGLDSFDGTC